MFLNEMVLTRHAAGAFDSVDRDVPAWSDSEVLIRVRACAVCRTDLHFVDGELAETTIPVVPGHQIVGTIERLGGGVTDL